MYDLVSGVNVAETRCLLVDGSPEILPRLGQHHHYLHPRHCNKHHHLHPCHCNQHHHSHPCHCNWHYHLHPCLLGILFGDILGQHHHWHRRLPDMKVNLESWSYGILFSGIINHHCHRCFPDIKDNLESRGALDLVIMIFCKVIIWSLTFRLYSSTVFEGFNNIKNYI